MKKYISPETLDIMVAACGILMGSQDSAGVMQRIDVTPGVEQFTF